MPEPATVVKPDSEVQEPPAESAGTPDPSRETDLTTPDKITAPERRENSIASINAARLLMLEADDVDTESMGKEEEAEKDAAEPDETGEKEQKVEETPAKEVSEEKAKPEGEEPVYEMQISGKTVEVSLATLKENYGLGQAGRQLMTEASELYKRAQDYDREVRIAPVEAEPEPVAEPDPLASVNWEETINAIQVGDTEEAAEALKGLVTKLRDIPATGGEPPVNVAEIEQRVLMAVDMKTALSRFETDYEDILADPITRGIALTHVKSDFATAYQDSQQNGTPMRSYSDILNGAGGTTRTWLEGIRGKVDSDKDSEESQPKPNKSALPEVDISPNKTEAKRSSVTPPSQRAPRTPATGEPSPAIGFSEEAEQKRRSADIAAIAKARGQHA